MSPNVVTLFEGYQRRRGLAESTVDARVRLLRRWIAEVGDPFEARPDELEAWIDGMELRVANSRATVLSHLHVFYAWAIRQGHTLVDPTMFLERPRVAVGLPRPIHPTDLSVALLSATGKLRVALLLAATSGLRCCEIARLRWDDVHDGIVRVLGKGSKERLVPLHPATVAEMDRLERTSVYVLDGWQSAKRSQPGINVSRHGNEHLHSLGIAATMHTLRHYAATEALRACGNLRKVQTLLGHASPATTAIYTRLDVEELVGVVESIPIGA
jgi:site-specific recombinase XerD